MEKDRKKAEKDRERDLKKKRETLQKGKKAGVALTYILFLQFIYMVLFKCKNFWDNIPFCERRNPCTWIALVSGYGSSSMMIDLITTSIKLQTKLQTDVHWICSFVYVIMRIKPGSDYPGALQVPIIFDRPCFVITTSLLHQALNKMNDRIALASKKQDIVENMPGP